ncbi:MAG: hypothetical protein JJE09_13210 [Bacteroidia bacterium]|nr:hypothetical protein [Bacteroidia bacterium]
MKIISLFTKSQQNQRFSYNPRYYDAKKEEMEERERRIKSEIENESGVEEDLAKHRSRIAGSFHSARKRSKASSSPNAAIIRTGVILFLVLFMMAFLTWGKNSLYGLLLFIPFYLYLKFKKKSKAH